MNEEQIKLIVSMQLRQVNQQLHDLQRDVNKAFRDIGNSSDVNHAADKITRVFKNLNNTSSQEVRMLYKNIRRYLRDIEQDTTKTTTQLERLLENAFKNLFNNGGSINLGGLSRALQNAFKQAGLGDTLTQSLSSGMSSGKFLSGVSSLMPLLTILGIPELNAGLNSSSKNITDMNKKIASMATQSQDVVKTFGPLMSETEALNTNMLNLQKILALLVKQFGQMAEMLQRIAAIQMGTALQNYGKYVSSSITQTENLGKELQKVKDIEARLVDARNRGDVGGFSAAFSELEKAMPNVIQKLVIAQNTLNNIKNMSKAGVFQGIDTGSLEMVDIKLAQMMKRATEFANKLDSEGLYRLDFTQLQDFNHQLDGTMTTIDELKKELEKAPKWKPSVDYTDVETILNEIDQDYIDKVLAKINGNPIKPTIDTSNVDESLKRIKDKADQGKITLRDLFNVFGGMEMFHQIDLDFDEETFKRMTQEAQEVKTVLDSLNKKYNPDVDYTSLNGVKEQIDKIKLALEAAATARAKLNELDQNGLGMSDEATEWQAKLQNAIDMLKQQLSTNAFGQYRLVDWTMFTRDASEAARKAKEEIQNRLKESLQGFSNTAGSILYRIGAYFTIPPERIDQILAQLRDKFSAFWDSVKEKGRGLLDKVADTELFQKIKPVFDKITEVGKAAADKIKAAFDKIAGSRFGAFINNNLSLLVRGAKAAASKLKDSFKQSVNKIKDHMKTLKDKVKDAMKKVKDHTKKASKDVSDNMNKMGTSIKGLIGKFAALALAAVSLKKLWEYGKDAMMLEGQLQNLYITLGGFYDEIGNKVLRGDQFQEWARTTAKNFAISEKAAIQYGNTFSMLLSQTIPQNNLMTATTDLLKQASLIAMKTGRTVDDVMNRIRSGLLGKNCLNICRV